MAKTKVTPELIDKQKFEAIVRLGLTNEELIEFFMINSAQLWHWIKLVYHTTRPLLVLKKMRVEGKIDFMAKQRKLAEKNPTISIWLGKNYYGQVDEKESDNGPDFEDLNPLANLLKDDDDGNGND